MRGEKGGGGKGYSNIVEQHRLDIYFGGVQNFEFLCFWGGGGGVEILRIRYKNLYYEVSAHIGAHIGMARLVQVGYIKLFIICIFFIILDISLVSFILIVNDWLV